MYQREEDICIICLDDAIKERSLKLTTAIHQLNYYSGCSCSCDVHKTCMKAWSDRTPKCPICRIKLHKCETFMQFILSRGHMKISVSLYFGAHVITFYVFVYTLMRIFLQPLPNADH